jgi:hypothetical protein
MRNVMPNYTKLFSTIVTSTIWQEPDRTRIVWITMLALSDKNGEIHASIPGLARIAGVPTEACEEAINAFLSPDKYSRTPEHEGRRIAKIDGGWELLNFEKYRQLASTADTLAKNATRQKRFRERNAKVTDSNASVTHDNATVTANTVKAEAEADTKAVKKPPAVATQSDDEWLRGLQTVLAYEHLNVAAEYSRAKVWCETNRRQCTRKFFTNWLNRASANNREIAVTRPAQHSAPTPQPARETPEQRYHRINFTERVAAGLPPILP